MNNKADLDNLSMAARVLKIARRLPVSYEVNESDHADVRRTYIEYCERHSLPDQVAAKAIGRAASTLNQWKHGNYAGDNNKITRLVNSWLERDLRQRTSGAGAEYIHTEIAHSMSVLIDTAIQERCCCTLIVPSGAGKTLVLETKTGETAGFYVYVDEDDSPVKFLAKLASVVGLDADLPRRRTAADIKSRIVEKIGGSGRPIFIDEAHRLPAQVFGRIRSIHDQAGSSIILAGTHEIIDRVNDRASGKGQMASRCLIWNAMEHVLNADDPNGGSSLGKPLFSKEEVRQFLEQQQVRLTDDGFDFAWALACLPGHGCLRLVGRLVRVGSRMKRDGGPLTAADLSSVLSSLFGQQGRAVASSAKRHISIATSAA